MKNVVSQVWKRNETGLLICQYPDFGSYVSKEHITPEQLAAAARGVERQQASRAYKEGKRTISQQMQDAAKQAEADRGQSAPKKNAPDRGER